jgi:hypothetical protein
MTQGDPLFGKAKTASKELARDSLIVLESVFGTNAISNPPAWQSSCACGRLWAWQKRSG